MKHTLLLASALLVLAGAASGQILPTQPAEPAQVPGEEASPDWNNGLVWGLAGGGVGLALIAGAVWFLGVGGLRHVDKDNVLEHPMRRSLLEHVEGHPGVHLRELANSHSTAVTNTQWHLRKLEQAGLVKTDKVQGRRLYYPTRGGIAVKEQALQNAAVQNPNAQRILDYLGANAGANQRTVAEALEMNPGTVRWHLRKMEGAGLVKCVQQGAQICYFVVRASGVRRPERPKGQVAARAK